MVTFFVMFVVISLVAFCAYRLGQESPQNNVFEIHFFNNDGEEYRVEYYDNDGEEFNVEEGSWV